MGQNKRILFYSMVITKNLAMEIVQFNRYNPQFDNMMSTHGNYDLRLPADKMQLFMANKYIILNDTYSFGFKDEDLYSEYDMGRKENNLPKGLILAVDEFLLYNPQWFIFERFANNNGITILKRK